MCGLKGFAAAALLTHQRDTLTEIRIDGMRLHRSTFHMAGGRYRLYLSRGCHNSATAPSRVFRARAQLSG